jgi:hypothetical protein
VFPSVCGVVACRVESERDRDAAKFESFPCGETSGGEERHLGGGQGRDVLNTCTLAAFTIFAFVFGLVVGLDPVVADFVAGVEEGVDASDASEAHAISCLGEGLRSLAAVRTPGGRPPATRPQRPSPIRTGQRAQCDG